MCEFDEDTVSLAHRVFGTVVPEQVLLPGATLLELSGETSLAKPTYRSGLTGRVAAAWTSPMNALTCAQVCMLVGQKFGMRWLAVPVATFVQARPQAECRYYPGDLALSALLAHEHMLTHAPSETRRWLGGDFGWMAEAYAFDSRVMGDAADALSAARRAAGLN